MQIEKFSLYEFLLLHEEKKEEMLLIYKHVKIEVDCKNWLWIDVKETQHTLKKQITYQIIIDIVSKQIKSELLTIDAHVFFATFNAISKSVLEITEIENNAMWHVPTANEMIASEEVGGFEAFGYLPELDKLAGGDILKYEAIKRLSWDDCFSKLAYDARNTKYQNKIIDLMNKKND